MSSGQRQTRRRVTDLTGQTAVRAAAAVGLGRYGRCGSGGGSRGWGLVPAVRAVAW